MVHKNLRGQYSAYLRSDATELRDCYKSWSEHKQAAYNRVRKLFDSMEGNDFRIVNAGCYFFSVGFIAPDKDTGELYFCYITYANVYCCPLSDCEGKNA